MDQKEKDLLLPKTFPSVPKDRWDKFDLVTPSNMSIWTSVRTLVRAYVRIRIANNIIRVQLKSVILWDMLPYRSIWRSVCAETWSWLELYLDASGKTLWYWKFTVTDCKFDWLIDWLIDLGNMVVLQVLFSIWHILFAWHWNAFAMELF